VLNDLQRNKLRPNTHYSDITFSYHTYIQLIHFPEEPDSLSGTTRDSKPSLPTGTEYPNPPPSALATGGQILYSCVLPPPMRSMLESSRLLLALL